VIRRSMSNVPRQPTADDAGAFSDVPLSSGGSISRTTTDGQNGAPAHLSRQSDGDAAFHHGRHRWLGQLARDHNLPGAAVRVAILLWEKMNARRGYAWPSLAYIGRELKMHRSTVIRSLRILSDRGWINKSKRGGRHRSNEYRISFGVMDDGDT